MPGAIAVLALMLGAAAIVGPDLYGRASASPGLQTKVRPTSASPELPRARVEVSEPAATGRTIHVAAGDSLQSALDEAKPGDRITLEAGATYKGPFRLPKKDGDAWIVITSNRLRELPAGKRVNPSQARHMPKLLASSSVIVADKGAHHYRIAGVEVAPADGEFIHNLIELGSEDAGLDDGPHHIVFDRSYVHGDPRKGGRRGFAMNGRNIAVVHSYVSDFKEVGADSQAIAGWNGPGPFKIENNYLEAAGENVMFGGADPAVKGLVPADIEILRNHFSKPLRWKIDHPSYEGTPWAVKNLFELKNARRVLVDGNLLEYNWPHAQNGFAILFTVRNQDGGAPWSVVDDVTFSNNVVRHVAGGVNILGRDDNHPSQQTRRIAIRNNVFLDVGGSWGNGRLFQLLESTHGVAIVNNTGFQTGSLLFGGDHPPHTGFVFEGNVVPHNEYGITASGTGPGSQTLDKFFPGAVFRGNVLVGGNPRNYPVNNSFPATLESIGAVPPQRGSKLALPQLTLPGSTGRGGTEGRPPGADIAAVQKALGPLVNRLGG